MANKPVFQSAVANPPKAFHSNLAKNQINLDSYEEEVADQPQVNPRNQDDEPIPEYMQHSKNPNLQDDNLTVYTNDSFLDQSHDFEQTSTGILDFNQCLIDSYKQFSSSNIPSLIQSLEKAH